MEVSLQTQTKIINLVKQILSYYIQLEQTCESNPILYYTHTEFDSNVTEFEGLSNSNKIVLATKLDKKYIPGIMRLFQTIYDNNFYMFEGLDWILEQINWEYEPSEQMISNLLSYDDMNLWLHALDQFNADADYNEDKRYIGDNNFYDYVPAVCSEYYKSNKRQKIYRLEEIVKLLNE
jgi:hypothetical protein